MCCATTTCKYQLSFELPLIPVDDPADFSGAAVVTIGVAGAKLTNDSAALPGAAVTDPCVGGIVL